MKQQTVSFEQENWNKVVAIQAILTKELGRSVSFSESVNHIIKECKK